MRVVVVLLLSVLLLGCSAPTRSATFVNYEVKATGQYQKMPSLGDEVNLSPVYEGTGNATVKLDGGSEIVAACPVQGLKAGAAVRVQQNADGSWAVVP